MSIIRGHDLKLYADATDATTIVAKCKTCTLKIKTEMQEVSSPTTGTSKSYLPKRTSWSISASGLLTTNEVISAYAKSRTLLYVKCSDGHVTHSGQAYISSYECTGAIKSLSTYSVELQGTGDLA